MKSLKPGYRSIRLLFFLLIISQTGFTAGKKNHYLPVISINTHGQDIVDEPKINATMEVYPKGNFKRRTWRKYNIGIEIRGQTSQYNKKKQYAVETRRVNGKNRDVPLLGMPWENDWVLAAPYDDKTLIRDVLSYNLYSLMGWYAPRTQFCILYINDEYRGIYVLTEKIKKDKNRVNIEDGEKGGFLLETSVKEKMKPDEYYFTTAFAKRIQIIKYPKKPGMEDSLHAKTVFDSFEKTIFSNAYPSDSLSKLDSIINIEGVIDYILLSEAIRNLDAFHASTFWSFPKSGKLLLGPIWDCNLAFGNACYQQCWKYKGLQVLEKSYPKRLLKNSQFKQKAYERWKMHRENVLSSRNVLRLIDSLTAIIASEVPKNFEKWDILGRSVYPNHFVGKTYNEEVNHLKNWIINRLNWLDYTFGHAPFFVESVSSGPGSVKIINHYSNSVWRLEQLDKNGSVIFSNTFNKNDSVYVVEGLSENECRFFTVTSCPDSLSGTRQKTIAVAVSESR